MMRFSCIADSNTFFNDETSDPKKKRSKGFYLDPSSPPPKLRAGRTRAANAVVGHGEKQRLTE